MEEGIQKANHFGLDGIMIGRAVFGNPWLFTPLHNNNNNNNEITLEARLACMIEHTLLWESLLGRKKSFAFLKKHFRRYSFYSFFLLLLYF